MVESLSVSTLQVDGSAEISDRHFGTVVTSNFGWQGFGNPSTSYALQNYPDLTAGEFQVGSRLDFALESTGARSLRYPGGTEAWSTFKWREEDQIADETGLTSIEKLKKVIDYCAVKGYALEFTFPVRNLGSTPEDIREEIQYFLINHLLGYADQHGVQVNSIKIGNEYNIGASSGNQISAEQYGDIASSLVEEIGTILDTFELQGGGSSQYNRPDLIIESGVLWRFGYADIGIDTDDDGKPDGNGIQDTFDIFSAFSTEELEYLDGIDLHNLTLNLGFEEFYGTIDQGGENGWLSFDNLLKEMVNRWNSYIGDYDGSNELDFHSLAWSMPRSITANNGGNEYAALTILQLHAMSMNGMESAVNWQATGFTNNALVQPAVIGQAPGAGTVSTWGKIHFHMANELIGFTALETTLEYDGQGLDAVAFGNGSVTKIYFVNFEGAAIDLDIDLSHLQAVNTENRPLEEGRQIQISVNNPLQDDEFIQEITIYQNIPIFSHPPLSIELDAYGVLEITFEGDRESTTIEDPSILKIDPNLPDPTKFTISRDFFELEFGETTYAFTDISHLSMNGDTISLSSFAKSHKSIVELLDINKPHSDDHIWEMVKMEIPSHSRHIDSSGQLHLECHPTLESVTTAHCEGVEDWW